MKNWYKHLVIILPTYNESENISILLSRIYKLSPLIHVIIIDDSSKNEQEKIKHIVQKYGNVQLITRTKKSGRGSAVFYGFAQSIKKKSFQFFIEMDTDLAHDPREIPKFFEAYEKTHAGLLIGSRYLAKSKIVKWTLRRLLLSKMINRMLNFWLGLSLHDYTNGFRMYHRSAIEHLLQVGVKETNFVALSESAYKIKKAGFTVCEVPITFTDRKHGASTVGTIELLQCFISLVRIRIRLH